MRQERSPGWLLARPKPLCARPHKPRPPAGAHLCAGQRRGQGDAGQVSLEAHLRCALRYGFWFVWGRGGGEPALNQLLLRGGAQQQRLLPTPHHTAPHHTTMPRPPPPAPRRQVPAGRRGGDGGGHQPQPRHAGEPRGFCYSALTDPSFSPPWAFAMASCVFSPSPFPLPQCHSLYPCSAPLFPHPTINAGPVRLHRGGGVPRVAPLCADHGPRGVWLRRWRDGGWGEIGEIYLSSLACGGSSARLLALEGWGGVVAAGEEGWCRAPQQLVQPAHTPCLHLPALIASPALPPAQRQHDYEFDPLDVTKTWPEDLFPLQPVGRMVLNRCAGWSLGREAGSGLGSPLVVLVAPAESVSLLSLLGGAAACCTCSLTVFSPLP